MCSLMDIIKKNGKGNSIPAIGIHVTPKQIKRYTNWKAVKAAIYLNGTSSTNEAWRLCKTLQKERVIE